MNINSTNEYIYNNSLQGLNKTHKQKQNSFENYLNEELKTQKNIDEKLLKEQTDEFEAFMLKSVLDISVKLENPLFGKDAADNIYNSMYNDTMSRALSGNLGFSELLFNFLKERM